LNLNLVVITNVKITYKKLFGIIPLMKDFISLFPGRQEVVSPMGSCSRVLQSLHARAQQLRFDFEVIYDFTNLIKAMVVDSTAF